MDLEGVAEIRGLGGEFLLTELDLLGELAVGCLKARAGTGEQAHGDTDDETDEGGVGDVGAGSPLQQGLQGDAQRKPIGDAADSAGKKGDGQQQGNVDDPVAREGLVVERKRRGEQAGGDVAGDEGVDQDAEQVSVAEQEQLDGRDGKGDGDQDELRAQEAGAGIERVIAVPAG